jgi:hypothetical protein
MQEGVSGWYGTRPVPRRIPPLATEVALTLQDPPGEATHWTAAAMAGIAGVSQSSVQRIWRSHSLQPPRVCQFKLSNDVEEQLAGSRRGVDRFGQRAETDPFRFEGVDHLDQLLHRSRAQDGRLEPRQGWCSGLLAVG